MKNEFYSRFNRFEQNDLFRIIIVSEEYTTDAIDTALTIVREKGWQDDLNQKLAETETEKIKQEIVEDDKIVEKFNHYRAFVEFKEENNPFEINISDVPQFESELINQEVPFYRDDNKLGFDRKYSINPKYYFRDIDVDKADAIQKKLNIKSAEFHNSSLELGFYLFIFGFLGIVLIIIATLIFD